MTHGDVEKVVQGYGVEAAREFSTFQVNQMYAMKECAEKEKLDCDAILTRCFEVTISESQAEELKETYKRERDAGLDFIRDVDFVGPKHVERLSGVKGAKAGTTVRFWGKLFLF